MHLPVKLSCSGWNGACCSQGAECIWMPLCSFQKYETMGLWIESPHLTQGGGASQSLEAGARYFGGSDATFALLDSCSQSISGIFIVMPWCFQRQKLFQELREQVKKLNEQLEEILKIDMSRRGFMTHSWFSLCLYEGKFATFCNGASNDSLIGGTWTFAAEAGHAVNQLLL